MHRPERQSFCPWVRDCQPGHILVARLHAIGDVAVTFPWCASLRRQLPHSRIDFLTSAVTGPLAESTGIFDSVHEFPVTSNRSERLKEALRMAFRLRKPRPADLMIDLQRNYVTRLIRRILRPVAWGEFDRLSPLPAGRRVEEVFRKIGFPRLEPDFRIPVKVGMTRRAEPLLIDNGWDERKRLIVLNPAGLWPTRNWPLENYIRLASCWLSLEPVHFLFLGTDRIAPAAGAVCREFPDDAINLVGKTSLDEAFAVLQFADGVVTEDSGLMHMAWISGIPTVAIFGSTNHLWSAPDAPHCKSFHSGDLPCGDCMKPECEFNDIHCLTRVSPGLVIESMQDLFARKSVSVREQ